MKKGFYKKVFVIGAALFILFAPIGITMNAGTLGTATSVASIPGIAANIAQPQSAGAFAFPVSFNMNLAFATTTTTGAGAGTATNSPQPPDFWDCAKEPATCGVYYVALTTNGILALLMAFGGWLVQLGLQFNDNIFNSPAIQTGFSVSLAIANLGFVLGIIIIAIATIIRNQTYGIKQLLWKLVVMAILVNFGLVITAPIVGFAGGMSNYFINATTPTYAGTGNYEIYVAALMGAFNPQTISGAPAANSTGGTTTGTWSSICQSWLSSKLTVIGNGINALCQATATPTTNPADTFWQTTMALAFDIVFSSIAVFTFLCLAVLLVVRYLMLGGLLIILPLAWLTFIFPKFDNNFSKWWSTFVKWVFFPPLALFFIYLAFTTAVTTNTANNNAAANYTANVIAGNSTTATDPNNPVNSMATQTGLNENIFAQAADEILLAGLMIMGLLFASSLAGKAGETVVHGGYAATKGARTYIGRKTAKTAARIYQGAGGSNLNAILQRSRIPLVPTVGRKFADLTEAGTKKQVDSRHKDLNLKEMDDERLTNVTQGLRGHEDQLAALKEWQSRGKLDKVKEIGGVSLTEWLAQNKDSFKNFTQGKLQKDINTALMSDDEMRRIAAVKAAAIKKASIPIVDTRGVVGPVGATVDAEALAGGARVVARNAEDVVDNKDFGPDYLVDHFGRKAKAADILKEANASIKEADSVLDKKGNDADIVDKEGLLGAAGQMVKAGDLMRKASEKFWEGKDKGDTSKMRTDDIFGDKPKFGLDADTLNELGKATTHGMLVETNGLIGPLAGKTDNRENLARLMANYARSLENAKNSGQLRPGEADKLEHAMSRILASKLTFMGGAHEESHDAPTPAATPPAAAPPPAH